MATASNKAQMVKDYTIKEKLGTGSYGVVYKVLKRGDKHYSVLKQISLFNMEKHQIKEVKNESKILASLYSAFVVKYYESFIENNNLNIVMEYCDGGDLCNFLNIHTKQGKMMSEERIWKFFIQISLGLAFIHSKKVLHRDLKTLNIFLTKDDKVRIGDLGVAKVLSQSNFAKTFVGTPYYLSPEICEEKPYNEKSDVWALGCILYEMATFKHPFNANNQGALILKILRGKYDPISTKDYSVELQTIVNLLLEKSHFMRPSMVDLIKHPYFLNKAKSLDMIDQVIASCSEINLPIQTIPAFREIMAMDRIREVDSSQSSKKSGAAIREKKNSVENVQRNIVKNVKLELNQNNADQRKSSEDPSKRFIQMNLPSGFKKQLQIKKDKKALISKQINLVKDNSPVGYSSNNQGKILNVLGNVNNSNNGNNLNNANPSSNLVSQNSGEFYKEKYNNANLNNQKDKKTPTKLIKKDDVNKKEINSNYPSNNQNNNLINRDREKQKVKEVYLKMNDFDSKLDNSNKKPIAPSEYKSKELPKRPQSALERDNLLINPGGEKKRNNSFRDDDIMDEFIKYNINKKILENPEIKNVERAKMIISRPDKLTRQDSKDLKSTNLFLNDEKRRTQFFNDLNIKDSKFDNVEASRYVDELLKGSNAKIDLNTILNDKFFNNKASISDFIVKTKEENFTRDKEHVNGYLETIMDDIKNYQDDKVSRLGADNDSILEKYKNKLRERRSSKTKLKPEETENVPSIPLYKKDMNYDFSVCYINDNNNQDSYFKNNSDFTEVNSTENNSAFANKNMQNTMIVKDNNDSYEDNCEECYEEDDSEDSYYETDEEAVEIVKNFRNSDVVDKGGEEISLIKDKNKIKELNELKDKFTHKIDFHKTELKKISGDVDFNKIYQAYQTDENPDNIDEISQKIEKSIRNLIPHSFENFNLL